jgi:SSS family solute:Na+ symporter
MIMPPTIRVIPGQFWIPNFYYWGLNQFITQRTLAAKSLKQGQLGIIFAALLKLTIPFIIIMPGIISYQLYKNQLTAPGATTTARPTRSHPNLSGRGRGHPGGHRRRS